MNINVWNKLLNYLCKISKIKDKKLFRKFIKLFLTKPQKSLKKVSKALGPKIYTKKLLNMLKKISENSNSINQDHLERILKYNNSVRTLNLTLDDTCVKKYGKTVHAIGIYRDGSEHRCVPSNNLVDMTISTNNSIIYSDFLIHKPMNKNSSKSLQKLKKDKIKTDSRYYKGFNMIHENIKKIRKICKQKLKIWLMQDSWYTNRYTVGFMKELNIKFIAGIKSNSVIKLFGKRTNLKKFFKKKKEQFLTVNGHKYPYKSACLFLPNYGRYKALAVYISKKWRYFISNSVNSTVKTLIEKIRSRWAIEELHRCLKNVFGLKALYVRTKNSVISLLKLPYLLRNLLMLYNTNFKDVLTPYQLIEEFD